MCFHSNQLEHERFHSTLSFNTRGRPDVFNLHLRLTGLVPGLGGQLDDGVSHLLVVGWAGRRLTFETNGLKGM